MNTNIKKTVNTLTAITAATMLSATAMAGSMNSDGSAHKQGLDQPAGASHEDTVELQTVAAGFDSVDNNDDQVISRTEAEEFGFGNLFAAIDMNGDAKVTLSEYHAYLSGISESVDSVEGE